MKIFYDILDDLEKIGSDSKETVVANVDSDNSNLKDFIMKRSEDERLSYDPSKMYK